MRADKDVVHPPLSFCTARGADRIRSLQRFGDAISTPTIPGAKFRVPGRTLAQKFAKISAKRLRRLDRSRPLNAGNYPPFQAQSIGHFNGPLSEFKSHRLEDLCATIANFCSNVRPGTKVSGNVARAES